MDSLIRLIPLPYPDAVVALGAAALGVTAGVLGSFAVLRRRSLVGDALSHAALPGVCIAFLLLGTKDASLLLLGAAGACLLGALLIVGIERSGRLRPDGAIGVVLSSFFSLGIVLLTFIGHRDNANQAGLERYLFGQAAGLLQRDILVMGVLGAVAIAVVVVFFRPLKTTLFDPSFAGSNGLAVRRLEVAMTALLVVAIIVGIRTVGAILMVAMLVAPTVAARQFTSRLATLLPLAGVFGVVMGVTGSLASSAARVPTGPVIVLVAFSIVLLAVMFAPQTGVAWNAGRRRRERRRLAGDALLLDLANLPAGAGPHDLVLASSRPPREVRRATRDLLRSGRIVSNNGSLEPTPLGRLHLAEMDESMRLWSLWLEHGGRIRLEDAREPDPRNIKRSLGEHVARQLEELGSSS